MTRNCLSTSFATFLYRPHQLNSPFFLPATMVIAATFLSVMRHAWLIKKGRSIESAGQLAITIPGLAFSYWMIDRASSAAQFHYHLNKLQKTMRSPVKVDIQRFPFVPWTTYTVKKDGEKGHTFRVLELPCIAGIEHVREKWEFGTGVFKATVIEESQN
jgi:hypothetical protein